ncbi:hypothetical protein HOD08_05215 [bacterium]|nr:hypothetical protein [bacterium]
MNKVFLIVCFIFCSSYIGARDVVDKIVARVNGVPLLMDELNEQRFDRAGKTISLSELALEEVATQDSERLKIDAKDDDVDRRYSMFREGYSDEAFGKMLKESGMTQKRLKRQLRKVLSSQNLRGFRGSQFAGVISQSEIQEYYEKNPVKQEYEVSVAVLDEVPKDGKIKDSSKLEWNTMGFVALDQLSDDAAKAVKKLKKGKVSEVVKRKDEGRVYRLDAHKRGRVRPLEERVKEIEEKLITAKNAERERVFLKNLRGGAHIAKVS